ncbi:MAG: AMMECR1 domain-containing protein, partial [Nitrospinaceae bacterium]|nr:AMMECR1 domain-containing protein [Nitrospinaceae bacterium]
PIDSADQLNPQRYGLSVKYKGMQGILLPDLEGIDTVQRQIDLCLKKGDIPKNAPYEMHRFEVERYH